MLVDLDYPGSEARAAASLMLMCVRSQLADSDVFGRDVFQLFPWQIYFKRSDAIRTLEGMRKPVLAITVRGECPALALWSERDLVESSGITPIATRLSLALEISKRSGVNCKNNSRSILVVGRDERLLVGLEDVAVWSRDYVVDLTDFSIREPTDDEGAIGAAVTIALLSKTHLTVTPPHRL
jgi:hypothetical protein